MHGRDFVSRRPLVPMNHSFDTIIAGSGLAGSCAAFVLSENEQVLILDAEQPGCGASGVPVGLISPLMARRARPVWRMEEAMQSFHHVLAESKAVRHFSASGVRKPARSEEQATEFRDASMKWPDHGRWFEPESAAERWPYLFTQFGVLEVTSGGAVSMPAFCQTLVRAACDRGAESISACAIQGWDDFGDQVTVQLSSNEEFTSRRLLLCLGEGYTEFSELRALRLHPIKGQWIRLISPDNLPQTVAISSGSYLARDDKGIVVGSSYELKYSKIEPTEEVIKKLHREACLLIPSLRRSTVTDAGAGIRVTVPEIRLPMLGSLPGSHNVWIFTGLGAKGLLMAPLLAYELPKFFEKPSAIPKEISVNLHGSGHRTFYRE